MNRRYLTSRWWISFFLLFSFSSASTAWSQTPLERLENQIRQRVGQQPTPPPPQPGISAPNSAIPETEPASPAENREPGYLGLLADDSHDRGRGVRVLEVRADGPAAKGGLKKQDLITSVAGVRTRQMSEMSDVLNLYAAGEVVEFEVLRDNKPLPVKVTLGRRPPQNVPAEPSTEAIPPPPGEAISNESTQAPSKDASPPEGAKKSSFLEPFKLKSTNPGEQKPAESGEIAPPALLPPRNTAPDERPNLEQLQKRVEELERRVAELEKALADVKRETKIEARKIQASFRLRQSLFSAILIASKSNWLFKSVSRSWAFAPPA